MSKVLIIGAAVLPSISGALHRPPWIIPTCAALAVIGFVVTDPQAFERLRQRDGGQMEYTIVGMLSLSTILCAGTFTIGHLLRYVMFRL